MSTFSASVATTGFALLMFAAAIPAQSQTETQPQTQVSVSKVRIVRLSEIRGAVQLDRSIGHGYEPAIVNLPVVEQNRLKTAMGVAEVEFEDNSTLRVGPDSEIEFVLLGRTAQGTTVSTIRLVRGTAYVSLVKSAGKVANVFDVAVGDRNIHLQPETHVRLETDNQWAKLAVLSGTVHVDGPNGEMDVSRKNTATFALAGDTQPAVAKGIRAESLDAWDKQLDQYHSRVASITNVGGAPYSYGLTDMSYYGAFANMGGGCGMMWRPYFASAAWDPYSNGTWAYYDDAGYSWVSPYPWGWTPYHYGSWSFCPGAGWGWAPGGSWMGLNNVASATSATLENGITGRRHLPVVPLPPRVGGASLIAVNQTALVHSGLDSQESFVFRKDSAGLGIPRNELGNLRGFSERAVKEGAATTPIYLSAAPGASNGVRGASNAPGLVVIQRGYAPSDSGFSRAGPSGSLGSAPVGARSSSMSSASATASAGASGGSHH